MTGWDVVRFKGVAPSFARAAAWRFNASRRRRRTIHRANEARGRTLGLAKTTAARRESWHATNPASHPELLDMLADDFVAHHYDARYMIKLIMTSQAYAVSSEANATNADDEINYSHAIARRLTAEQLLDAQHQVTGVPAEFTGYPRGMRAGQIPGVRVARRGRVSQADLFLTTFGKPPRELVCECERSDDPNLSQVLHLMNGSDLNTRLTSKTGRITALFEKKLADAPMVEELYLAAYARYPTPAESRRAVTTLSKAKDKRQATEDLFWALLNAKEFFFNH